MAAIPQGTKTISTPDAANRGLVSPGRVVRSVAALLTIVILLGTATLVWRRYDATIAEAHEELRIVNELATGQIARLFEAIDLALRTAGDIIAPMSEAERSDSPRLHEVLRGVSSGLPQIRGLYLVDADDFIVASTIRESPTRRSIGDRSYVRGLKQAGGPARWISEPIAAFDNGESLIHVARRVTAPDGRHLGIVAVSVRPSFLARIYETGGRMPDFGGRLYRDDALLVAVHPEVPNAVGQVFTRNPLIREWIETRAEHAQGRAVSTIDGQERLADLRRVPAQPLLSTTSVTLTQVLTPWRQEAASIGGGAAALALMLFATMWWLSRELDRREAATRALLRAAEAERRMEIAQATNLEKSRLLASASHDLRQPLHAISLFASALARRVTDGEQAGIARNIERASRSMNRMFDSLLDVAKLDAGIVQPMHARVALGPLIEQLHAEFVAELEGRPVELRVVASRAVVQSDPAFLETMLRNLLTNASRYTRTGNILLGCRRRPGAIEIQVWDTGKGIAAADRDRVFTQYVRLDQARDPGGLGLGLSVVRDLGRALGHDVGLRSWEGRGSCFSITVPVAALELATAKDSAPAIGTSSVAGRILVLDDDFDAESATALALRDCGFTVVTCADARQLERALAAEAGVAVLDLELSGADHAGAVDALVLLEQLEHGMGRPIDAVIITGSGQTSAHRRLQLSGRPWLTKPCDPERLVGAILVAQSRSGKRVARRRLAVEEVAPIGQ